MLQQKKDILMPKPQEMKKCTFITAFIQNIQFGRQKTEVLIDSPAIFCLLGSEISFWKCPIDHNLSLIYIIWLIDPKQILTCIMSIISCLYTIHVLEQSQQFPGNLNKINDIISMITV